jgi:hypothetical protein
MEPNERRRAMRRVIWGVFMITLGGVFLMARLHYVDLPSIWKLWPAVFAVVTVGHIVEGRYGSALTSLLLGFWFFACQFDWYGFTYGNSWPVVLIAVGAGIVVRALRAEPRRRMWDGGAS